MLSLFRQRDYACFWSAGLITMTGDWAMGAGLPIYIYLLTHSVYATGAMLVAKTLPRILASPLAGVLVDRWDRRRILVVTNLFLAATVLLLLLVTSPSRMWIVYVESVLLAGLDSFIPPAASGLLPRLVTREQLPQANSMAAVSFNLSQLVGPALGGWLAARHGLPGLVAVDGASFVLAAALTALVRPHAAPAPSAAMSLGASWLDGIRTLFSQATLRLLLLGIAIVAVGDGVFAVFYPVFVSRVLHGGAEESGFLLTAQAVGALAGGLCVGILGRRALSGRVIGTACVLFALTILARCFAPRITTSFTVELALFAAGGFVTMFFLTGFSSLVILSSPDSHRGRINSSLTAVATIVSVLGMGLSTLLVSRIGVAETMSVDAFAYLLVGILAIALLPPRAPEPTP